jgi:hypothetical protein
VAVDVARFEALVPSFIHASIQFFNYKWRSIFFGQYAENIAKSRVFDQHYTFDIGVAFKQMLVIQLPHQLDGFLHSRLTGVLISWE